MSNSGFVISIVCLAIILLCVYRNARNVAGRRTGNKKWRGASSRELSRIQTFKFSEIRNRLDEEDTKCAICLEYYEDDEEELKELRCGHHFHLACVDSWLSINHICP
jgi:hypothetical protein